MEQKLARFGWRPVDPPRRPVLFVNPRSGGGTAPRARVRRAGARERDRGRRSSPRRQDLAALVDEAVASGADALGMAGGDGSLAVVAAAAAAHGLPFICIPGRDAQPLRARPRGGPARRAGRARRVHRRGRAPDRRGLGERPPVPQQRLAGDLRRRGPPGGLSRRQAAHPAGDRGEGARSQRAGARAATWSTIWDASTTSPRSCSFQQPLRAGSPARAAPARRSTAASLGSSSSTPRRQPAPPGRAWSAPHLEVRAPAPVTPASTARRWISARRCVSRSARRRCGSGSRPAIRAPRLQRPRSPSRRASTSRDPQSPDWQCWDGKPKLRCLPPPHRPPSGSPSDSPYQRGAQL